jgi:hypothetical protein
MKVASKLLLGLALFQGAAFAANEPKIEVIDGKISISAQAVPLGRFLALFDKAMGMKSEVKAGLENRNMSVQFSGLNFNDAVRKIFQGQPYNYVVIQGRGIRVTDLAQGGGADSQPVFTSSQPINQPFNQQPFSQPINAPIQQLNPNPNAPPASNIFGGPAPVPAVTNPNIPLSGPGVMPPPIGASNPLNAPVGGPNAGGNVIPIPGPGAPPPAQPAAPGTLPGASPGAAPGQLPR